MKIEFKQDLKHSYDESSKLRDKAHLDTWKLEELDRFLSFIQPEKNTKIVDLGSGTGQQGLYMKENGLDVTCIDLSPAMVQTCLQKGLTAYQMDFYELEFEDNRFDGVWAMNTLLHVPKRDLVDVLLEIKRVMKPGSLFYLGVYGGYNSEGIWEEDTYSPKRFFSFYDETSIKEKVTEVFKLHDFRTIQLDRMKLNYQGMILKKEDCNEKVTD